jgi:hypothetical protein
MAISKKIPRGTAIKMTLAARKIFGKPRKGQTYNGIYIKGVNYVRILWTRTLLARE